MRSKYFLVQVVAGQVVARRRVCEGIGSSSVVGGGGSGEEEEQQQQPWWYSDHHCCCECYCRKHRHYLMPMELRSPSHARPPSPHPPRDTPGMSISEAREKWPPMTRKLVSLIDEVMEAAPMVVRKRCKRAMMMGSASPSPKASDTAVLMEVLCLSCVGQAENMTPNTHTGRAIKSAKPT